MKFHFSKNFVVRNFLKVFYIVATDSGLVYAETCFNSSLDIWHIFVVISSLNITSLRLEPTWQACINKNTKFRKTFQFHNSFRLTSCNARFLYWEYQYISLDGWLWMGVVSNGTFVTYFFPCRNNSLVGHGVLIMETSRTHSDTQHSLGLLCRSNRLVAETSTW